MGLLDDVDNEAKNIMNGLQKKQQIEQLAKEKDISVEQAAKEHLSKNNGTS